MFFFFFFQAEDGIRAADVTGVQTCALPISRARGGAATGRTPPCPRGGGVAPADHARGDRRTAAMPHRSGRSPHLPLPPRRARRPRRLLCRKARAEGVAAFRALGLPRSFPNASCPGLSRASMRSSVANKFVDGGDKG